MLETKRLAIRLVQEHDLPGLLAIYTSNPDYIAMTEGPGGYDLPKLQRDWLVATSTPGRSMVALFARQTATPVGVAEWLERNPRDGFPWLGLLMVKGDLQGQGLGSEALVALFAYFREKLRWPVLRLGVIAGNERAREFWERHGFSAVETVRCRLPVGSVDVVCMERRLADELGRGAAHST